MKKIIFLMAIFTGIIAFGQQEHSGGISIGTGFKLEDPQPIDDRTVVADSASLHDLTNVFEGLTSYSVADSAIFVYDGINWNKLSTTNSAGVLYYGKRNPADTNNGFFIQSLNAFKAPIGLYAVDLSVADGGSNRGASGYFSFASGHNTTASGENSSALGDNTTASGVSASAFGIDTKALGGFSSAFGNFTIASGENSSAFGNNTRAESYGETAMGVYSTEYEENDSIAFNSGDRLFNVGNGAGLSTRSDAFTILKNAKTGINYDNFETTTRDEILQVNGDVFVGGTININDEYTLPSTDGTSGQVLQTDGSGNVTFETLPFYDYILTSEKGANNGVATLDSGGKVPATQLPNSIMTLEGEWNANTNTPTLADGTGDAGMIYQVTTAGTQDLGSGNITFNVGDFAVYGASGTWFKSTNSNEVISVNGQTGAVSLDADDVGALELGDIVGTAGQLPFTNSAGDGIELRKIIPSDLNLNGSTLVVPYVAGTGTEFSSGGMGVSANAVASRLGLRVSGGRMKVGDATESDDAVNLGQANGLYVGKTGNQTITTGSLSISKSLTSGGDRLLLLQDTDTTNGHRLLELKSASQSAAINFNTSSGNWDWFLGAGGQMRFDNRAGQNSVIEIRKDAPAYSIYADATGLGVGLSIPTQSLDVVGNARFRSIGTGTFDKLLGVTSTGVLTTAVPDYYTQAQTDELLTDKAEDDEVVHLTGSETISGAKTFSGNNNFTGDNTFTQPVVGVDAVNGDEFTTKDQVIDLAGQRVIIPLDKGFTLPASSVPGESESFAPVSIVDDAGTYPANYVDFEVTWKISGVLYKASAIGDFNLQLAEDGTGGFELSGQTRSPSSYVVTTGNNGYLILYY